MSICDAISKRALIEISYDGGTRLVEPYCHGTSKAGNEVLRGFQIRGHSNSGHPQGWKLFTVQKMDRMKILEERFEVNRPLYNPMDSDMIRIHCHV